MRIDQLLYFIEISKHPSLNAASDKLHISHQSLNKAIKGLEQELGTQLLERTPNGTSLTDHGRKTLEIAKNIVNQVNDLKVYIDEQTSSSKVSKLCGQLSVVGTPLSAGSILSPSISNFRRDHPKVNIALTEVMPHELVDVVRTGGYDFGIVNIDTQLLESTDFSDISYHLLYTEKSWALVHKSAPLARSKALSIHRFLKQPLIIYGNRADQGNVITDILQRFGSLSTCHYTNNMQFYNESLLSGQLATIITQTIYQYMDPVIKSQLILIPFKENIQTHVLLVYSSKKPLSKVAKIAIESFIGHYLSLKNSLTNL